MIVPIKISLETLIHEDQIKAIITSEAVQIQAKKQGYKITREEVLEEALSQFRENQRKRYPPKKKWYQKRIIIK